VVTVGVAEKVEIIPKTTTNRFEERRKKPSLEGNKP